MKKISTLVLLGLLAFGTKAWSAEEAAPSTWILTQESTLSLEGDSTLHKWHSTATTLSGSLSLLPNSDPVAAIKENGLKTLTVNVPVQNLESGKKGLDKNLRKELKEEEFPTITYSLKSYETESADEGKILIKAVGNLTVAGVSKEINIDAHLAANEKEVSFEGSTDLLMSDYGIDPPKMFLGTLKTADKVTVHFNAVYSAN